LNFLDAGNYPTNQLRTEIAPKTASLARLRVVDWVLLSRGGVILRSIAPAILCSFTAFLVERLEAFPYWFVSMAGFSLTTLVVFDRGGSHGRRR
jgi:hypothetical protein